jgi:hypothetical protein
MRSRRSLFWSRRVRAWTRVAFTRVATKSIAAAKMTIMAAMAVVSVSPDVRK